MKRLTLLAFLLSFPVAPQQQPDPDSPLIRVTVNLVQLDAIVTDKSGQVITDLTAADFDILQDGKSRKITRFAYIPIQSGPAPRPPKKLDPNAIPIPPPSYKPEQVRRTIVLVVDDLALSFESMYYVRDAIKKFTSTLQPGDRVAMMRTGSGAGAFQSFTTDHAQINQLADTLRWNFRSRTGSGLPGPANEEEEDSDSPDEEMMNRSASLGSMGALQWMIEGLAPVPGRKSIVLLSEGFKLSTRNQGADVLNGVLTDPLRRLTDQASRAGVVIYAIDPRGLQPLTLTAADDVRNTRQADLLQQKRAREFEQTQQPLRLLAAETGGRAFLNSNKVDDSLRRVLDDQAGFYLLGYDPEEATFDRKYHKIAVKVKRKGLEVRSRQGFVGVADKPVVAPSNLTSQQVLVRALNAPFQSAAVPVKLTGLIAVDPEQQTYLHCLIHVGIESLQFTTGADGKLHADLELLVAGFDANGASPHNSYKPASISVDPAKRQEAFERGFLVSVAYPIKKPGPYQLRVAIRDRATGAIGTASQFVLAPDLSKGKLVLSSLLVASGTASTDRMRLATRLFQPGEDVAYSLQVLNPKPDSKLTIQVRLFEEGKALFEGAPMPIADPRAASGVIRLGNKMKPGDYSLQVVITDSSGPKPRRLSQWTDLHVKAN
jgi:VWFA-related protein